MTNRALFYMTMAKETKAQMYLRHGSRIQGPHNLILKVHSKNVMECPVAVQDTIFYNSSRLSQCYLTEMLSESPWLIDFLVPGVSHLSSRFLSREALLDTPLAPIPYPASCLGTHQPDCRLVPRNIPHPHSCAS